MERNKDADALRRQTSELEYSAEREERLKKDLEKAMQRVKNVDETVELERAAHLESKFNSESIQEAQQNLSDASKELSVLRSECADREALVGKAEMELQNVRHHWDTENMCAMKAENEIQKLTKVHQKDSEDKLTFLHNLYQRLAVGCVLIKQPEGLLGRFSWPELCTVLQEHVDALTSDLHRANEKISHLEYACKKRDDAMKEQQTQENKFCKQAKQVKERKAGWQKRKKDLEQHYSALTGEVHAREQIETLVLVLSSEDKKRGEVGQYITRLQTKGLMRVFGKALAVIAARRFQRLGKASRYLFSWAHGFQELPGLTVFMGGAKPTQLSRNPRAQSASHILVSAAQNSFSKLMDQLSVEMHNGSGESAKSIKEGNPGESLFKTKRELRRKDQSLRQLGKHLSQLEQDKLRLEESIRDAERALRMAAK
ncbi:coiled-coil domain-containing protein 171-like [Huso huso]|uniref:Coiled-coil domain-containing protein 171-like n=1 Tax=Huso huso TaxID=61971 RepID=A0ABR1A8E4_HUSHU